MGRHPDSDIRIDLPQISRRHCCVAIAYDRVVIRDLGSRNGLWINGLRTDESLLNAGDEVAIGPLLYRVEDDLVPEPARTPPVPEATSGAGKPPSLPFLPEDPDDDLVPLDL